MRRSIYIFQMHALSTLLSPQPSDLSLSNCWALTALAGHHRRRQPGCLGNAQRYGCYLCNCHDLRTAASTNCLTLPFHLWHCRSHANADAGGVFYWQFILCRPSLPTAGRLAAGSQSLHVRHHQCQPAYLPLSCLSPPRSTFPKDAVYQVRAIHPWRKQWQCQRHD